PRLRLTNSDARPGSESGKPNISVYWRSTNIGTNGLVYKKMTVREISPTAAAPSDTTPPLISGVSASGLGQTSATVNWTTSEAADGQVEYGLTAAYGSLSALNAAQSTGPSAAISGLTAGTLYHYRVKSRDAAGNLATSTDATFTTLAATASSCLNSAGTWQNAAFAAQAGVFTAEFDATPSAARVDGVSGLSGSAATSYTELAAAVRMNNAGTIDARNGGGYAAAASIPYSANIPYHFRLVVNVPARTYSAYVKQGNAAEQVIGLNYAFRSEQSGASSLGNLALIATAGSQSDCAVKISTAGAPAPEAPPTTKTGFYDNFSTYTKNACFPDRTMFGPWLSAYSGYGCVQVGGDGTTSWLEEKPLASVSSSETHASMALGPSFSGPLTVAMNLTTVAQLRRNSPPNPWEVAWAVWNYTDDTHFYYFVPKPNGWELGKEDPAYPGAQRFLASGSTPTFPIGRWYNVKIVQDAANTMKVYVDDRLITTFTDTERPYTSGRVGFYNEDSQVRLKDIAVNTTPAAASAAALAAEARAPQMFLSPALRDGINDVARFGTDAEEVHIFDLRGVRVFHASQRGGVPIVWDGRDGSGQVRQSGVY
ncbi:MAG: hypothetical protein HYZ60_08705, partial [Methylocystis sp.]|nr:hypothetical protein [Methylocystis sp.]